MAAIALLHPFPFGPPIMAPQAEALRAAGHQVIVPDLLAADTHRPQPPDLSFLAQEVFAAAEAAGQTGQVAVAGLSLGGYVAMAMLADAPHRVAGLALMDTKAGADDAGAAAGREAYAARVVAEGMAWVPSATLPGLLGETTREQRPDIVEQVRQWILASDPAAVAWTQRAMAARPDSLPVLAARGNSGVGPSLVLVGAEDTLSPPALAQQMAAALGGAPLVELPGAGHLTAVECPQEVSDSLVAWAARLP
ncbi:MAG: alpha/beta hydrolase [Actinobacteria bacterium]|nr:MAG: alpha/beta hydrolase [Actinomycetota bacterium]